jgi:hypothetical protein
MKIIILLAILLSGCAVERPCYLETAPMGVYDYSGNFKQVGSVYTQGKKLSDKDYKIYKESLRREKNVITSKR